MASASLILGSLGKSKGADDAGSDAGGDSAPLDAKAAALKSMWLNMKAGDFDAAAMDFHDAYMACQEAESAEEDEGSEFPDLGGEPGAMT